MGIEGAGLEFSFVGDCTGRLLDDVRIFILYATRRISIEWDHRRVRQGLHPFMSGLTGECSMPEVRLPDCWIQLTRVYLRSHCYRITE